jgi:hypothetical protein
MKECSCYRRPLESNCGEWANNQSICVCVSQGLEAESDPAPS